jgi:predicted amidohydrolase
MATKIEVSGAGRTRNIAIFQGTAKLGDKPFNISKMKENIKKAHTIGVELVAFPELFTTGYFLNQAELREMAEDKGGETFQELSECAKEHEMVVVYGYVEKEDDRLFNSAMMIGKDGSCLGNYRKSHLFGEYEKEIFAPGNEIMVVDVGGLKIGVLICYDFQFPELVRALALKGANLIVVPIAIPSAWNTEITLYTPVRACESCVFMAYANFVGSQREHSFSGGSCCVDPNGVELVRSWGQESLLTVNIDPEECRRTKIKFLADRRPEMYGSIVL